MRSKLVLPAVAVVALSVSACGSSASVGSGASVATSAGAPRASRVSLVSNSRPTRIYPVKLSGEAETPPGAPHGSGVAIIAFHGASLVCWRFAHLHGLWSNPNHYYVNIHSLQYPGGAVRAQL